MILTIKKKARFIIFTLIFIIVSPIVVLYAKGDIFTNGWGILSTGGIYVTKAPTGSEILLNSKQYDTTSFFKRDILIKNLRRGTYDITVKKEGYNSWSEKINVSDNLVSDAHIFILPEQVKLREITKYITSDGEPATSTTIIKNKNQEYIDIAAIFATTSKVVLKKIASTSIDFKSNLGVKNYPIMSGKIGLWQENNIIYSKWFGTDDAAPKYFCDEVDCTKAITVFTSQLNIRRINFLPQYDGVVLIALADQIFAIQTEKYINKIPQVIYRGASPDFRIIDDSVYIKDKNFIAEVIL